MEHAFTIRAQFFFFTFHITFPGKSPSSGKVRSRQTADWRRETKIQADQQKMLCRNIPVTEILIFLDPTTELRRNLRAYLQI